MAWNLQNDPGKLSAINLSLWSSHMTIRLSSIGLASVLAISCVPSFAQVSAADWSVTGNASLVSDYRFRGISQTNKGPAFQGGFDLAHSSGFYVGNWNSNVDSGFLAGANLEMDFYGGFRGTFDAFSYDVGGLYYYYYDSDPSLHTGELYVAGGWGPVSLKYSYAVTDFFGWEDSSGSWYLDAKVSFPINEQLTLIGRVGYQSLEGDARVVEINSTSVRDSITDWQIGATYNWSGWVFGASYIGTDRDLAGSAAGGSKNVSNDTFVVSVSKSF
jgi:uncharacterized protein (TIGR02001 family)